MPVSEAVDEPSAKLKMSALIESAVRKAFLPPYQTKIVEYDDVSVLTASQRHGNIQLNTTCIIFKLWKMYSTLNQLES
jgi:hypothetical protein